MKEEKYPPLDPGGQWLGYLALLGKGTWMCVMWMRVKHGEPL